ncbi:MAG TPA: hypothetical protein VFJ99_04380 [Solirubrobacterales bacterium]|nr:hypothetical protein [Solirubrobacterales bacterium]
MVGSATPDHLLAIYLNDHLAGSTVGVELARRVRSSNEGDAEFGAPLAALCAEIEADRETLERLMDELEIGRSRLKTTGAFIGEKLGRLKPNGQLTGYSPLSRMLELEVLSAGVGGKLRLWRALASTLGVTVDGFDFDALASRAEDQLGRLADLHRRAALRALPVRAAP